MFDVIIPNRAALLATVILLGQTAIYYTGSAKEVTPIITHWSEFPKELNGWKAVADIPLDQQVLDVLKPDDYLVRNYTDGEHVVSLFIGYFNTRRNGRAPHSPQWCLPGAGWKSLSTQVIDIPLAGSKPAVLPVNQYIIEKGMTREVVIYWYHQGTRAVANEIVAQVYALPDLIFHGRTDTALVRIISSASGSDLPSAKSAAIRFAGQVYPLIRKWIS